MKPLLYHFKEHPSIDNTEDAPVEYNHVLNLTVLKGTDIPVVNFSSCDTETFTKASMEGSDSDNDFKSYVFDTSTHTRSNKEGVDSDNETMKIARLIDTTTLTETQETSDQDRDN